MGRELGRISGPLLADNLKRNGTDLAFENSLLYLNVTTSRIGINSMGPSSDLTIGTSLANGGTGTGTLNTTTLSSAGTTNIGNFTITSNTIQHLTGGITISPNPASNPTTVVPALSTANLYFSGSTLSNTVTNSSINIAATGTGQIKLNSNVLVSNRNLLINSQNFGSGWNGANPADASAYITANATTSPTGDNTGQKLYSAPAVIGSAIQRVYRFFNFIVGNTYTFSTYAKASEYSKFWSFIEPASGRIGINVDLIAQTVSVYNGSPTNLFLTSVGNGWYRTGFTWVAPATENVPADVMRMINNSGAPTFIGDGSSGIYVWGAQLELSSTVTTYVPTTDGTQPGLHATGNITFDGNITLGDSVNDRITFVAEVASDILPVAVLNAIAPAAQRLISQSGKLFAGIDDETLLFIAPKNTIITPVSEPFTTQDGQVLYAQDGSILYNNQAAPYIGSSYLYNLGSPSLNWGTVYSNTVASKTSITAGTLTVTRMNSGNIHIEGTTIANNYPGDSLYFSTSGTGYVSFNGNNLIVGNNINVPTSTNSLIINSTGTGYVKFAGTNGFVTPVGNTSNRPSSPQQGQMRFNTSIGEEEIYDVNAGGWIPIYGPTATIISEADMSDNSILYAIIFGR